MHVLDDPHVRDGAKPPSCANARAHAPQAPKKRRWRACWAVLAAAVLVLALGAGSAWAYNYYSTSFEWYTKDPGASTFTIRTAGELEALSAIVNGDAPADPDGDGDTDIAGAVNFEGKTVELAGNVNLLGSLRNLEFTPIGKTEERAFAGTFDGKGFQISGLKITKAGAQNVGLFGVVAETGALKNVNVASTMSGTSEIVASSAAETAARVGSLAGWCKGVVENCASAATVKVSWDDGSQGTSRQQFVVAENVGGLVGICDGALSGSSFTGAVEVRTSANAKLDDNGDADPFVARNVGGVAGRTGGIDWADAGVEAANANPSAVANCSNSGSVSVYTIGQGGTDRFGETVEAKSENVGGVVGYAGGNVSASKNTGNVLATGYDGEGDPFTTWSRGESTDSYEETSGGGVKVGGIAGALRAGASGSANSGKKDAGVVAKQAGVDPYIVLEGCTNTGYVSGLNAVGGIVGTAGTFTTVTHCVNGNPNLDSSVVKGSGYVRTTRWNKPNGGGIAGQSLGTVSWSRNHAPVINTKIGYYCGGIAGALFDYDEADVRVSDMPEIYGCYNTGQVTSYNSGAILGENNGYVHDCVALKDTDLRNILVYATSWAIVENCVVAFPTQAEADKATADQIEAFGGKMALGSGQALAVLNTQSLADGYTNNYYFIPLGTEKGWPVLDGEDYQRNAYDLSALQVELACDGQAAYSLAHDAVPNVTARAFVDGSWVDLVPNVDFYVKADPAAAGQAAGDALYQATVCGMGNYTGSVTSDTLAYRIVKGDLSQCTVVATPVSYNRHAQNNPSVMLLDGGKAQVDASQYRVVSVNDGADCIEPGDYQVVVEALEGGNYTGQVAGDYAITKVNLIKECDLVGFTWQNRVWYYDDDKSLPYEVEPVLDDDGNLSYENGRPVVKDEVVVPASENGRISVSAAPKNRNEDGSIAYGMAVEYTGSSIEPEVIGALWQYDYVDEATGEVQTATELLAAPKLDFTNPVKSDLKTLYGVSATPSANTQYPNIDIGEKTGGITVAYGSLYHFHNYWVSLFDITSSVVYDLSNASVSRYGDYVNYVADDKEPKVPALDVLVGGREVTVYEDYQYQVVKTTDAEGNVDETPNYAIGHKVYYKLVSPKDDSSITIEEPWEIAKFNTAGRVTGYVNCSYSPERSVDFSEFDFDAYEQTVDALTVSLNPEYFNGVDNKLKQGFDYEITGISIATWEGEVIVTPTISVASFKDRGVFTATRSNMLRGSITETYVADLAIDQDLYDTLVSQGKGWFGTVYEIRGNFQAGSTNKLAWCKGGYSADDIASHLAFTLTGFTINPAGSRYQSVGLVSPVKGEKAFEVTKIVNAQGEEVDRALDEGTYTITVSKDAVAPYENFTFDNVEFEIEVTPVDLSLVNDYYSLGGSYSQVGREIYESLSGSGSYPYTGEVVNPTLELLDALGGVIDPSYYKVEGVATDVSSNGRGFSVTAADELQTGGHLVGQYVLVDAGAQWNGYKIVAADITADNIEVRVDDATFTGSVVQPDVTFWDVTDAENPVKMSYKLGQDYTLEYANNISIAAADAENAPSVTVRTCGGNMVEREVTKTFSIKGSIVDVSSDACKFDYASTLMVGKEPVVVGAYKPADAWLSLEQGGAFTVTVCSDAAGQVPVADLAALTAGDTVYYRIDGVADRSFTGSKVLGPVTMVAADDSRSFDAGKVGTGENKLSVSVDACTYTGALLEPAVTVKDGDQVLSAGVDYTVVSYASNIDANGVNGSKPVVTIAGLNGYAGTGEFGFTIAPANFADVCTAQVTAQQVYNGSQLKPASDAVRVMFGDAELPVQGNWSVKESGYGENLYKGEAAGSLVLVGEGNFAGELPVSFDIVAKPLTEADFTVTIHGAVYTGAAVTVDPAAVIVVERSTSLPLDPATDYTVVGYKNNDVAGTATVNISGTGNYSGNMSGTFAIKAAALEPGMVSIGGTSFPVAAGGVKPAVTVTLGGIVLPEADYTVSYGANNVAGQGAGTVTVAPSGNGNLVGDAVELTFDITDDIAAAVVEVVKPASSGASGTVPPVLKVTYGADSRELVEGVDYEVEYRSGTKPGTATALIVGKGLFAGSSQEFTYSVESKVVRLAGESAADTAAAIAAAAWQGESSEWVILARDDDFADAMSATGLAGALDAPIVLTDRNGLSDAAKDTIESLGVKNVYIVGGTGAMPGDFEGELAAAGVTGTVERVFGNAAWDTSAACAQKIAELGGSEYAVVAMSSNFQDALSMSSFAYRYHAPILLQDDGASSSSRELPEAAQSLLTGEGAFAGAKVIVAGGAGAVPEESMAFLGRDFDRVWGNSGYDTSAAVAEYLVGNGLMSASTVVVASGAQDAKGLDALAGAALAGRAGGVMLLASAQPSMEEENYATIDSFLADNRSSVSRAYVLGGNYVMPESLMSKVSELLG